MSELDPTSTTLLDVCKAAMEECGRLGTGQSPSRDDIRKAWSRCQWLLQQWEIQRLMVYHMVTRELVSTGARSYTIGPGGDLDTTPDFNGDFNRDFNAADSSDLPGPNFAYGRPTKLAGAFVRMLPSNQSQAQATGGAFGAAFGQAFAGSEAVDAYSSPNYQPVDFSLTVIKSYEDYDRLPLKHMLGFPQMVFYDPAWPLGRIYTYPVALAGIYTIGLLFREQLPVSFAKLDTVVSLPPEYWQALILELAMLLRGTFGLGTWPGDTLPQMAKIAKKNIKASNTAVANLQMPNELVNRRGSYNIFSDQ